MQREERKIFYLKCFMKAFSENGIDKTTIKKMARAADMSEASIYQYFKNKDEIIIDCVKLYFDNLQSEIFPVLKNERLTLSQRMEKCLKFCKKNKSQEKFAIQVLTSPSYGKLCAPVMREFHQNLVPVCDVISEQQSVPKDSAYSFLLLFLSVLYSGGIMGDESTLAVQVDFLQNMLDRAC